MPSDLLRRIAAADLPRDPCAVRVLHHTSGGVLVVAVTYAPSTKGPFFFTVAELPTPNVSAVPLRLVHVRVPAPATEVTSLTLLRGGDGELYVVVQAVATTKKASSPRGSAQHRVVSTYLYRRQEVAAAENSGDEEYESEEEEQVYAPGAKRAATEVRYQRLPRAVEAAGDCEWTATAAFSSGEYDVEGDVLSETEFVAVSRAPAGAVLQLLSLHGTRCTRTATCILPALAGFPVGQVLTIPGTRDVVLLRHHNTVLECDVAAIRALCERTSITNAATITTMSVITRVWRCDAGEDAFTSCAVKDALLLAGTLRGRVLLWDLREPHPLSVGSAMPPIPRRSRVSGAGASAAVTGMVAPYRTAFVTADACASVRVWRDVSSGRPQDNETEDDDDEQHQQWEEHGVLRGHEQSAAGTVLAPSFPFRPCAPVEAATGLEACAMLEGDGNFLAAVMEGGRLGLYFCH